MRTDHRINLKSIKLAALSFLFLIAGCAERSAQPLEASAVLDAAIPAPNLPSDMWTLDEQFAQINRLVPGFAGLYLDGKGILNIRLIDTKLLHSALPTISAVLGDGLLSSNPMRISVPAKYSFNRLAFWKQQMIPRLNLSEMVSIDIDDVRNTVTFGVLSAEAEAKLRSIAESLGIPDDAVHFRIEEPITFMPGHEAASATPAKYDNQELFPMANTNVRLANDPRIGGIEIDAPNLDFSTCTLGFNANLVLRSGATPTRGFVTNSHCTHSLYTVDASNAPSFKQPYNGAVIGREVKDPTSYPCGSYGNCRYSESAFVAYSSNIASIRQYAMTPARTNSGYSYFNINRVVTVNNSQSGGTSANQVINIGQSVFKTGRTTGTTIGNVTAQCVDSFLAEVVNSPPLVCQYRADFYAEGGDSGSPVYLDGKLYGLFWGGSGPGRAIFSPMSGVKRDLGDLKMIGP